MKFHYKTRIYDVYVNIYIALNICSMNNICTDFTKFAIKNFNFSYKVDHVGHFSYKVDLVAMYVPMGT